MHRPSSSTERSPRVEHGHVAIAPARYLAPGLCQDAKQLSASFSRFDERRKLGVASRALGDYVIEKVTTRHYVSFRIASPPLYRARERQARDRRKLSCQSSSPLRGMNRQALG
jgi:hypothetical protein